MVGENNEKKDEYTFCFGVKLDHLQNLDKFT